ncbi:RICIN domain-containing protein [Plantactinospora sp. CA-294935]|uniref:RICIN domain-containing protein n=1 Tax=Plantactinospora sp. CA-294935 TaxID=3240012 RepID=UPI003D8B9597
MASGVVLALAVLTGAGGFAARQAASAAEPLAGASLSAQDVRILVSAGFSCVALTPARLAGQVMVASNFGSRPVAEMRERGATGTAALTPEQWEQNVPWTGARPTDREAAITALARLTCRLVGQSRAVNIKEDPWRVALAAYRVGLEQVIAAGGIPGDAKDYVDTVERYARWYALQPALGGGSATPAATSGGSVASVPDAYVNAVVAAGRICPEMPPARIAAQITVTTGFDPNRLGSAGEQGIAHFLPNVWAANVQSSANRSPWNPSVAIPALGRTMCKLIKQAGGQYAPALAAFARGDETAAVGTLAEAVTKAEAQYAKDSRLQAPRTVPAPSKPEETKATAKPTRPARDNQPAVKAAGATGRSYGPYFIRNLVTEKCVDLPGLGEGRRDGPVNQFTCNRTGDDNQEWTFEPRAVDGEGYQLYWIRNADDGFCVDPPGLETVQPATTLNETGCSDRDNQYFRLEPKKTSGGLAYYWLRNTAADMCLDVLGVGSGGDAARLTLFPCHSNDDHEWALVEKSEW